MKHSINKEEKSDTNNEKVPKGMCFDVFPTIILFVILNLDMSSEGIAGGFKTFCAKQVSGFSTLTVVEVVWTSTVCVKKEKPRTAV